MPIYFQSVLNPHSLECQSIVLRLWISTPLGTSAQNVERLPTCRQLILSSLFVTVISTIVKCYCVLCCLWEFRAVNTSLWTCFCCWWSQLAWFVTSFVCLSPCLLSIIFFHPKTTSTVHPCIVTIYISLYISVVFITNHYADQLCTTRLGPSPFLHLYLCFRFTCLVLFLLFLRY